MSALRLFIGCIVAASLISCNDDPQAPSLRRDEQQLVDELVAIYKAQLLELAQREESEGAVGPTRPELEPRLAELGREPERAAMVLQAVRDSLELFRTQLLEATRD